MNRAAASAAPRSRVRAGAGAGAARNGPGRYRRCARHGARARRDSRRMRPHRACRLQLRHRRRLTNHAPTRVARSKVARTPPPPADDDRAACQPRRRPQRRLPRADCRSAEPRTAPAAAAGTHAALAFCVPAGRHDGPRRRRRRAHRDPPHAAICRAGRGVLVDRGRHGRRRCRLCRSRRAHRALRAGRGEPHGLRAADERCQSREPGRRASAMRSSVAANAR